MATSRNISITPELLAHAQRMVDSGKYDNISEYMRALVRRDQEHEELGAWLRKMNQDAVDSGAAIELTPAQLGEIVQSGIERAQAESERKTS